MTAWHVTTEKALKAILKEGIVPNLGPRSAEAGEKDPLVYLFPDSESCENAVTNWLGEAFDEHEKICAIEVDLHGLIFERNVGFEITLREAVPPSRIMRIVDLDEESTLERKERLSSTPG